jgi:hypothetical protein
MKLTCIETELLFIDYLDNEISDSARKAVDSHLSSCDHCRKEIENYRSLFTTIASQKKELPGPLMRENFNTMLQSELNIVTTAQLIKPAPPASVVVMKPSGWITRIAACLVLILGGIFIGLLIRNAGTASPSQGEMAELKSEVRSMKEALMFNLLSDQSASERIKAVSYADGMNNPGDDVIDALFNTLNTDDNVNVRLAALDAINKYARDNRVRDSLVASLRRQKEPILQIVLINILTGQKETKAKQPIKEILQNKETLAPVKEVAEKGLKLL